MITQLHTKTLYNNVGNTMTYLSIKRINFNYAGGVQIPIKACFQATDLPFGIDTLSCQCVTLQSFHSRRRSQTMKKDKKCKDMFTLQVSIVHLSVICTLIFIRALKTERNEETDREKRVIQ